eukprot:2718146-Amphidinium_carterae.1
MARRVLIETSAHTTRNLSAENELRADQPAHTKWKVPALSGDIIRPFISLLVPPDICSRSS